MARTMDAATGELLPASHCEILHAVGGAAQEHLATLATALPEEYEKRTRTAEGIETAISALAVSRITGWLVAARLWITLGGGDEKHLPIAGTVPVIASTDAPKAPPLLQAEINTLRERVLQTAGVTAETIANWSSLIRTHGIAAIPGLIAVGARVEDVKLISSGLKSDDSVVASYAKDAIAAANDGNAEKFAESVQNARKSKSKKDKGEIRTVEVDIVANQKFGGAAGTTVRSFMRKEKAKDGRVDAYVVTFEFPPAAAEVSAASAQNLYQFSVSLRSVIKAAIKAEAKEAADAPKDPPVPAVPA